MERRFITTILHDKQFGDDDDMKTATMMLMLMMVLMVIFFLSLTTGCKSPKYPTRFKNVPRNSGL